MDAVKFIREEMRMCAESENCCDYPLYNTIYCSASPKKRSREEAEEIVRRVEEWSAAHPRKTRQSVFLEQYPEAQIEGNGVLGVCPAQIVHSHRTDGGGCIDLNRKCYDCRREFWMQEVE